MTIRPLRVWEIDPRFQVEWASGYPMPKSQQDAYFYRGASSYICTVKHEGFEVDIYCDGDMKVKNTKTEDVYRDGYDLVSAGFDSDEKLAKAFEEEVLEHDMNPWFDMYAFGEHLDNVHHEIDEILESACSFLQEEAENAKAIENFGVAVNEADTPSVAV